MMGGKKTWAAVIGTIATGIGIVMSGIQANPMDYSVMVTGFLTVLGGVALLGLGHKFEKGISVIREVLESTAAEKKS